MSKEEMKKEVHINNWKEPLKSKFYSGIESFNQLETQSFNTAVFMYYVSYLFLVILYFCYQ